jgi:D-glycero-D-manno-heptose 1,7-bisphosphate phosphatase
VFLDRDGTLVEEVPYLHDPGRVVLLPGVAEGLGRLAGASYVLVVVTNQAGVARGLYDEAAVAAVHRRLGALLAAREVVLDAVLYRPHHPQGTVAGYARACPSRKPAPGMLEAAARGLGLDLRRWFLIGNQPTDAEAAMAVGVTPLFVATGRGAEGPAPDGVAAFAGLEAAAAAVLDGSAAPAAEAALGWAACRCAEVGAIEPVTPIPITSREIPCCASRGVSRYSPDRSSATPVQGPFSSPGAPDRRGRS